MKRRSKRRDGLRLPVYDDAMSRRVWLCGGSDGRIERPVVGENLDAGELDHPDDGIAFWDRAMFVLFGLLVLVALILVTVYVYVDDTAHRILEDALAKEAKVEQLARVLGQELAARHPRRPIDCDVWVLQHVEPGRPPVGECYRRGGTANGK